MREREGGREEKNNKNTFFFTRNSGTAYRLKFAQNKKETIKEKKIFQFISISRYEDSFYLLYYYSIMTML